MNNRFYKKEWLKEIYRIKNENEHSPGLRLHRAERNLDFPDNFFNSFISSISQKDIKCYPDTFKLKKRLSEYYNIPIKNIHLSHGSVNNIKTFLDVFGASNSSVILSKPSFPMHWIYANINNCNIKFINYKDNFVFDVDMLLESINDKVSCICIANPNSPIGDILDKEILEKIVKKADSFNVPIMIDEAYIEFSNQESSINLLEKYNNLVVSRTFSKAFGAAGMRVGYMFANDEVMEILDKVHCPYELSNISTKFAIQILDNIEVVNSYIDDIKNEREIIFKIFDENSIDYIKSHTNTIHILISNDRVEYINNYIIDNVIKCKVKNMNNENWLCFSIYPGIHESKFFRYIVKL